MAAKVPNLLLLHVRLLGARDGTKKVPAKVPKLSGLGLLSILFVHKIWQFISPLGADVL